MRRPHPFFRALIILFCCWQMFAIAAYAVPDPVHDRVAEWFKTNVKPRVTPYVFATSQWQQWNLFSPDPMRRATEYTIYARDPRGAETPVMTVDRAAFRWWRRGDELTALRRLEDNGDNALRYWERVMQSYCGRFDPPPGSTLVMYGRYQVLPKTQPGEDPAWWRSWEPEWWHFTGPVVNCREAGRASDTLLP